MIVDTSALLAYFDVNEPQHEAVSAVLGAADELLVVSPYIVAELDYLILTRHGGAAEAAALAQLTSGAWELASMTAQRLQAATAVVRRYADQPIGIADASNMVLAREYRTQKIVTLDRRHFGVLRFEDGSAPHLLP